MTSMTWRDLRRMADEALANTPHPEAAFPALLDTIARAWGKDLDALTVARRELAEAHAALRDLAHELHDAALARNKDELWEWGRDSTQLDLLQRHGDAIRAAQEDKP